MYIGCYRLNWISKSLVSSVTDEHGRTMLDLAKLEGVELSKLKLGAKLVKGIKPSEDVLNSVGCELVVNDKFLRLLIGLRKPDWLRIGNVVVDTKAGSFDYHIVDNKRNRFDIADRALSKLTIASGVLIHADRIVVRIDSIPPFDIFPIKPASWVISEELNDRIKRNGISGLAMEAVEII